MLGAARRRLFANPQDVLRSMAGLKSNSPVGFLPAIPSNREAERAFYDLRASALPLLDREFLEAIRPTHPEPAHMLDAGIDAIGYAAFVQSRGYEKYPGIHKNLAALHDYLLNTAEPEIINYDLQVFIIVLGAAREVMPALAAATAALEPVLTEERIFSIRGRRLPEYDKLPRRIFTLRQQFARFFGESGDLNEVVARLFPLLLQEPDEIVLSYREMNEKIIATRRNPLPVHPDATNKDREKRYRKDSKQPASALKRKTGPKTPPRLDYYRPASAAVTDRITRGQDFPVRTVPASIKELYEKHGRELAKAQRAWLHYAKETWAEKSAMRWVPSDDGIRPVYLTQKIINPFSSLPEMNLVEEVQEERETIATILINLSCSMQVDDRYVLAYMIADRFGDLLTKGEVPTEIIGHTTTGEVIPKVVGRNRPIHYVVFKTREEPHNLSTVHRLCTILHTVMHYLSYDGEAIMRCCDQLKKIPAKRRLMFIVTDEGDSSGTYISKKGNDVGYFSARHFRDVVALVEAEKNVEIIGVPIKADASGIFSRSVRVDSIGHIYEKLSPFALELLRESNEHKRPRADSKFVAHRRGRLIAP
jgi:cobaltochelatase CobT